MLSLSLSILIICKHPISVFENNSDGLFTLNLYSKEKSFKSTINLFFQTTNTLREPKKSFWQTNLIIMHVLETNILVYKNVANLGKN